MEQTICRSEAKDPADPRAYSETVKSEMKAVYDDGFNIYALINRMKKELKLCIDIPEEVILKICVEYHRQKPQIRSPFPWFVRVFTQVSREYFSGKNRAADLELRKAEIPPRLKDIMRNI